MVQFIPVNFFFWEEGNTFQGITFSWFNRNFGKNLHIPFVNNLMPGFLWQHFREKMQDISKLWIKCYRSIWSISLERNSAIPLICPKNSKGNSNWMISAPRFTVVTSWNGNDNLYYFSYTRPKSTSDWDWSSGIKKEIKIQGTVIRQVKICREKILMLNCNNSCHFHSTQLGLQNLYCTGLLIFWDVAISHNWPQIATFRIIRQKSHNSGKSAKFEERTRKYLLLT